MKQRDWRKFWYGTLKSLTSILISVPFVPLFHLMLNTNWHQPGYWQGVFHSTRVGFEISVFCWLFHFTFYLVLYFYRPNGVIRAKKSVAFQIVFGLLAMSIGMLLVGLYEPQISGNVWKISDYSRGFLLASITFISILFFIAYRDSKQQNLALQTQTAEANLSALRNQMQPHFLFNSLNSLAELIEVNKDQAGRMTQTLADLYRDILLNSKQAMSTLQSEISIAEKYLELEKLRFGSRLNFEFATPSNGDTIYLPSLILQTLVENAIKHGISKSIEQGQVRVSVKEEDLGFTLSVANTGKINSKEKKSSGTGLGNTRERLSLLYGDRHGFKLSQVNNETCVSFWFSGEKA